ncbi:MAG: methyltransferase domain-containing protein [Pseudomonadota bacterium]
MGSKFFDRAYGTTEQEAVEDLYEDWAATYDADLIENGYQTPARCAAALAHQLADRRAPILDFACGTGLSGAALAAAGFRVIDGVDLSQAMLEAAGRRGVYRNLSKAEAGAPPPAAPGDYAAIAAAGALSPGAAPAEYFDMLLDCLAPGGLLAFSFNDHTLADETYTSRLEGALADGKVGERFKEKGDHIVKLGSKSIVYVLEKLSPPA